MELVEQDIQNWLFDWFKKRNPDTEIDVESNYYESGWIDSFGIVELISDTESYFDVFFSDEDLRNPFFRTIAGLTQIIARINPANNQ